MYKHDNNILNNEVYFIIKVKNIIKKQDFEIPNKESYETIFED